MDANPMDSEAVFLSKVAARWRSYRGGILAFGLGLVALASGCSDEKPQSTIAGKAHAIRLIGGTTDFEPFTLDTGFQGKKPLTTNNDWEALCDVSDPESPWMRLSYKRSLRGEETRDSVFDIMFLRVYPESSQEAGIAADLDNRDFFTGTCAVTFERTNDDPVEGNFSAPPCDLETMYGYKGRLEFAEFHVTSCNTEPVEPTD